MNSQIVMNLARHNGELTVLGTNNMMRMFFRAHDPSPKYWMPKYQKSLSLEQLEYEKMQEKAAK